MGNAVRQRFAGVNLSLVTPEHLGLLLELAQQRPHMWPRLCRDRIPAPAEFSTALWTASHLYVVTNGPTPCGLIGLYDWHQLNGTVWLELVPLAGGDEAEAVALAGLAMLGRCWEPMALRGAYLRAADYQPVPLADDRWSVERSGQFSDNAFAFGQYWDEHIYAIERRG